jgi:hypothetical protein
MADTITPIEPKELSPSESDEVMEGSATSAQAMTKAESDPALAALDDDAVAKIKAAAINGEPNPYPDNPSADQFYKDAQDDEQTKKSDAEKATGMDLSDPRPFDPKSSKAAQKNCGILRGLWNRFLKSIGLGPDDDPNKPENQAKLVKARADLEARASTETNYKKQVALKILGLLTTLAPILYGVWKYDQLQDQLDKLAAAFNSCNEVNYTTHTDKRLSCNSGDSSLQSKCKCASGSTTAPDLGSLCTDFDPSHACGAFSYVYMQYSIYDLIAALAHGAEDAPSWIWAHKWYILGAVIVIILLLLGIGMAKRYATG